MTEISAALVKELRDRTGAGMMECKRALQETNGDIDAAQRLLRERGAASAQKRAGRETTEGIVLMRADDGRGALVAVGCETEPVSKNDEFRAFAERDIYSNSDEVRSKPEQAREKIVEGMLGKRFFAAQVLTEQPWIHDSVKTVGQALQEEGAEVLEFERFSLAR